MNYKSNIQGTKHSNISFVFFQKQHFFGFPQIVLCKATYYAWQIAKKKLEERYGSPGRLIRS
jgi:hypothetical protein